MGCRVPGAERPGVWVQDPGWGRDSLGTRLRPHLPSSWSQTAGGLMRPHFQATIA